MSLRLCQRAGSQLWWVTGTVAGVRVRETTGTADRRLADEYRATREAELYRAAIHGAPARRATFSEVVVSYLQHAGPHSASTRQRLKRITDHFGHIIAADAIDQVALDQACTALLRPLATPATRLREIITPVRSVLAHGARRGLCEIPTLDLPRPSPVRTEWLLPDEVDRLILAAAPHLRPLITFLAGTGARLGEALALQWRDVDLRHSRAVLRSTKNGRDRTLDLCPRVWSVLEGISGPAGGQRIGSVFLTQKGLPYAPRRVQSGGQIKTAWSNAVTRAGIDREVSPHALRHTWASWHYAMHRDPLLLRHEGGWSSIAMVERYAHLAPATVAGEARAWRSRTNLTQAAPLDGGKGVKKQEVA